jgi:hypothetical protein
MNANVSDDKTEDRKVMLSTLWIFVLFNMIFADIVGFMNPGALEEIITGAGPLQITEPLLLVFSVLLEIPIAMVFLSRVLKQNVNRWANIISGIITILFVIGGGNTSLSYIFFASIEVVGMAFIVWYAWRWK